MTTYYVDLEGGAGTADGSSFANRKGSFTGFTLAAGDEVRFKGTPTATPLSQNATFTDGSITVTLTSAVTQNIYLDGAWTTASANVVCTTSTTRKEGSNSSSIAIAAAFTTGLAAYYATGTLDLSGYQQISFWIQPNAAVAANVLRIDLCSDVAGATPVNSFTIPVNLLSGAWAPITINAGSNLGSSIKSVALNCLSDPGTVTILIDDIIACKATSSADSLTLTSVIGKNGSGTGGNNITDYSWWNIKSINGTTIVLDQNVASAQGSGRGYSGTTETCAIYKKEPFVQSTIPATTNTVVYNLNVTTGAVTGAAITLSGGWDRTNMSTRNSGDDTLIDCLGSGIPWGLTSASIRNIIYKGFSCVRFGNLGHGQVGASNAYFNIEGCHIIGGATGIGQQTNAIDTLRVGTIEPVFIVSNTQSGITSSGSGSANPNMVLGNVRALSNTTNGIQCHTNTNQYPNTTVECSNNGGVGLYAGNARLSSVVAKKNGAQGVSISADEILNLVTANNTTAALIQSGTNNAPCYLYNASISEATKVTFTNYRNSRVNSFYEGGVSGTNIARTDGGTIQDDSTTFEAPSNHGRKFSPTSTIRTADYPLDECLTGRGAIIVEAGKTLTFLARVRRDNTGITTLIKIRANETPGLTSDITATAAASANTWETLTITYTNSTAIYQAIRVYFECYGGTTNNTWWTWLDALVQ